MDDKKIINSKIAKLLSKCDYHSLDILEKLIKLGFDKKLVNESLKFFIDNQLLDDNKFIKARIKYLKRKNYGSYYIKQKLSKYDSDIVNELSSDEDFEILNRFLQKKYNFISKDVKELNKIKKSCYNRGFSIDLINKILSI